MSGTFEAYEDSAGRFRFRLRASSGEVGASGRGYATKASAKRGCESVLKAAEGAPVEMADAATVPADVPTQNGLGNGSAARDPLSSDRQEGETGDSPSTPRPAQRQFRFAGGMAADHDLAARSGEILRTEPRQSS